MGIMSLFLSFVIVAIDPEIDGLSKKDSEAIEIFLMVGGIIVIILLTVFFIYAIYRTFTKSWKFVEAWDVGGVQYVVFQSRNKRKFAVTCKEDNSEIFFKTYQDVIFFIKTKENKENGAIGHD